MKKLGLIIWVIILMSCDKQIPYDESSFKPKLVVNAFNQPDSLLKIKLDESLKVLGNPSIQKLNSSIKIQLLKDSTKIIDGTYWVDEGEVVLPHKVEAGSIYHLITELNNYPLIEASDRVPIDNVSINIDTITEGSIYYKLDITVKDPQTDNFYVLDISTSGKELSGMDSINNTYQIIFSSVDKIFSSSIQTISDGSKLALFDDNLFNGSNKKIGIRILKENLLIPRFNPYTFTIKLKSVSKSMYDYYTTIIQNNNIYGGPLYFEGQIEGNINGGLGGFYFYNQYSDTIPFVF
tara:strand:+ start:831 stop:1709 length:879 start_codon:yes stop_codon:yes gene_type:complete